MKVKENEHTALACLFVSAVCFVAGIALIVSSFTGCTQIKRVENASLRMCAPACADAGEMTVEKCHDICDYVLHDTDIVIDLSVACYYGCEESVMTGKPTCEAACSDGVVRIFKELDK